jgi:hypothetical protein
LDWICFCFLVTSNDKGECFFPYQLGSFQMYFCEKTDPNLPSICPILNGNGSKMNCTEGIYWKTIFFSLDTLFNTGEYGYEIFEGEKSGSRSYQLESLPNLSIGDHCIELFYYLSDENSNGSIQVLIEDSQTNKNDTILLTSLYQANKWHQIRQNFRTFHSIFKVIFLFFFFLIDVKIVFRCFLYLNVDLQIRILFILVLIK